MKILNPTPEAMPKESNRFKRISLCFGVGKFMTKDLPDNFIGVGEVKGFNFTKLHSNDNGYLYEVHPIEGKHHYEVFERKTSPICVDFEKRIYSETDSQVRYPKSQDFGVWAWCITNYQIALTKFFSLNIN